MRSASTADVVHCKLTLLQDSEVSLDALSSASDLSVTVCIRYRKSLVTVSNQRLFELSLPSLLTCKQARANLRTEVTYYPMIERPEWMVNGIVPLSVSHTAKSKFPLKVYTVETPDSDVLLVLSISIPPKSTWQIWCVIKLIFF